jgi:glycosyltransferase involved in cell wall biosynthesis
LSCGTIANCAAAKEAVIAQEGALPNSVVVIPNGIDTDRFAGIPDLATTWGKRPPRIGAVANLRDVKGLDIFVRAAAIVVKHYPAATFVVAGEGDQRGALEALIAELGLTGRFELPGAVNDIPRFLSELDVAVLCSQSEGLSNALLEYMAAGRAIVATAVGGNVELVRHEENGLLVPAGDASALARQLDRLLNDKGVTLQLARKARQETVDQYGWPKAVRRIELFYRNIIAGDRQVIDTASLEKRSPWGASV